MKLLCRLGEHTQVPRYQLHQDRSSGFIVPTDMDNKKGGHLEAETMGDSASVHLKLHLSLSPGQASPATMPLLPEVQNLRAI